METYDMDKKENGTDVMKAYAERIKAIAEKELSEDKDNKED